MGLNPPAEETPVILAGLHHHRKIGQLGGPVVDVQTIKIVLNDAGYRLPGGIAVALINLHKDIKQIGQNMPGATAGIDALDLLRCHGGILFADLGQLGLHFWLLGSLVQIVFPVALQRTDRISIDVCSCTAFSIISIRIMIAFACGGKMLQPQTAQGVLHHIADNPVRGKQLSGGRDILLGDLHILFQSRENLILFLGVVILVQPADDLHCVLPVLLWDQLDHLLEDAALPQEVIREKQLGVIGDSLKHSGQDGRKGVALDDDHIFEQAVVVIGVLKGVDLLHIQAVQLYIYGLGQDLGLELVGLVGEHPHMGGQIPVGLHEA